MSQDGGLEWEDDRRPAAYAGGLVAKGQKSATLAEQISHYFAVSRNARVRAL